MERLLQGPIINSCLYGEHLDVDCFGGAGFVNNQLSNPESFKFEEEEEEEEEEPNYSSSNMPFLQMLLHSVESESPPFFPFTEPNFQTLLRLQHLKKQPCPWDYNVVGEEMESATQIQALELESCVTQDVMEELHSPVKSESNKEAKNQQTQISKPFAPASRERKKRKRQRPTKNKEEVESQRMTHIAVERNRRRQMNDHLNALRSLMPSSYIQRGDQASIIGGAIDFVKELEQVLNSLEAEKRMRSGAGGEEAAARAESKSEAADIEVTVVQKHVNLKVECRSGRRRNGQLVRAIVGLEQELKLTVLHLNITSSPSNHTVLYSFNLQIEEDCELESVEDIAAAVQQIFNGNRE